MEHSAIPVTPEQQAEESRAAVAAGAGAIHVHGADGRESLASTNVASALSAIRAACPGIPVGVSTGAWITQKVNQRFALINQFLTASATRRGRERFPEKPSFERH